MTPSSNDCSHDPLQQLSIFRQAATRLASTLDLDETLANAIGAFLPALGDFGFFDAVVDGGVRRTARAHLDPATEAVLCGTQWQRQEAGPLNLCALSRPCRGRTDRGADAVHGSVRAQLHRG